MAEAIYTNSATCDEASQDHKRLLAVEVQMVKFVPYSFWRDRPG